GFHAAARSGFSGDPFGGEGGALAFYSIYTGAAAAVAEAHWVNGIDPPSANANSYPGPLDLVGYTLDLATAPDQTYGEICHDADPCETLAALTGIGPFAYSTVVGESGVLIAA